MPVYRLCVTRMGYIEVETNSDKDAIEQGKSTKKSDWDWEDFDQCIEEISIVEEYTPVD